MAQTVSAGAPISRSTLTSLPMAERYLSGTGRGRASRSIPAALEEVVRVSTRGAAAGPRQKAPWGPVEGRQRAGRLAPTGSV
jgi:hypothetical protein